MKLTFPPCSKWSDQARYRNTLVNYRIDCVRYQRVLWSDHRNGLARFSQGLNAGGYFLGEETLQKSQPSARRDHPGTVQQLH